MDLVTILEKKPRHQTKGKAVFLTATQDNAPTALLHSLKHYGVIHEHNLILTVRFVEEAHVPGSERLHVEELSPLFTRVILTFGFMDSPNVPRTLGAYRSGQRKSINVGTTSFFLSRRTLQPSRTGGMPLWQDKLFIFLARNASDATVYFQIPTDRVVEIGTRITI